jgi:hypothetical protein
MLSHFNINHLPFALEGDTVSIFQGCLLHRSPWKDIPEERQAGPLLLR